MYISFHPSLSLYIYIVPHQVVVFGVAVSGGAEASQALLIQEDTQGVAWGHQHVDAQVKLEPVQEKRLKGENRGACVRTKGVKVQDMQTIFFFLPMGIFYNIVL